MHNFQGEEVDSNKPLEKSSEKKFEYNILFIFSL